MKNNLLNIMNYSSFELMDKLNLVKPLLENNELLNGLKLLTFAIIEDRNGDKKITIEDIKLISKDISAISNIISSLVLILSSDVSFKDISEDAILELLIYVFFIIVPTKIKIEWSINDREALCEIIGTIFELIKKTQLLKRIIQKVKKFFSNNICKCISQDRKEVVNEHLPYLNGKVNSSILSLRSN